MILAVIICLELRFLYYGLTIFTYEYCVHICFDLYFFTYWFYDFYYKIFIGCKSVYHMVPYVTSDLYDNILNWQPGWPNQ